MQNPCPVHNLRWKIELFGGLRAEQEGKVVARFPTQKTAGLLAFLAYHPGHAHLREKLIDLFWPDANLDAGRISLNQSLTLLRRLLETPDDSPRLLLTDRSSVTLNTAALETDVAAFQGCLRTARRTGSRSERIERLKQAADLYRGELLPGFYEEWIVPEAERLSESYFQAQRELTGLLLEEREWEAGIDYARRWVEADRLNEAAHLRLLELLSAAGEPSSALRHYRQMERIFREELNVAPSETTLLLVEEIRRKESKNPSGARLEDRQEALPESHPSRIPHNLPRQITSFIGREKEKEAIRERLARSALLTLVGPGGAGKTRLALEVASDMIERNEGTYPDGVWLIELASLNDPNLVPQAIATVLGIAEENRPLIETLVEGLKPRSLLLLIDNCEHLIEALPRLIHRLLTACPHLNILATSRESLRVVGEVLWPVVGLSLPDSGGASSPEELCGSEAATLFAVRAEAIQPGFTLTSGSAPLVERICRELDGLPLALELAAGRMRSLTVERIAEGLTDRFLLLSEGNRAALPRQQTLRATLEWSHSLLSPDEQGLFQQLAVFSGGWTVEAAQDICRVRDLEGKAIPELLSQLVEKSLVSQEETEAKEMRYRLLETVRQYALERMQEEGKSEEVHRRHLDWFLALAERAAPELEGGPKLNAWLKRLEEEHDNMRSALQWTMTHDIPVALLLGTALAWFWFWRAHYSEGQAWLAQAIAAAGEDHLALRARAILGVVWLGEDHLPMDWMIDRGQESLALARAAGDKRTAAQALLMIGQVVMGNDPVRGEEYFEEALQFARELGDVQLEVSTLAYLGGAAIASNDYPRANACFEEGLEKGREVVSRFSYWGPLYDLAGLSMLKNEVEAAHPFIEEGLSIAREKGGSLSIAHSSEMMGRVKLAQGDAETARGLFKESLQIIEDGTGRGCTAHTFEAFARLAQAQDQPQRAARLLAAGKAILETSGSFLLPIETTFVEHTLRRVRSTLGEEAFEIAWAEGRAMTLAQAMAYALEE